MRTSSLDKLDKKKQEKKHGKVVTMPDKTGDAEIEEAGGANEGAGAKAPCKGGKKNAPDSEAQEEMHNGAKKALDSDAQEELHKGAKKALRRAVKAEVKKDRERIAKALVKRTLQGDVRGTEMLLSLMEHGNKEGKDGKKKRSGPSLLDLLESEPEWEGEETETAAAVDEIEQAGELAGQRFSRSAG
jgi:hypothetical protein